MCKSVTFKFSTFNNGVKNGFGGKNSKKWKEYFVNYDAQLGNNTTLHKNHKPHVRVRLLTTGFNTVIENLSRFIETICASLTSNLSNIIKDTSHLLDLNR